MTKTIPTVIHQDWYIEESQCNDISSQLQVIWNMKRYISVTMTDDQHKEYNRLKWLPKQLYLRDVTLDIINSCGSEIEDIIN